MYRLTTVISVTDRRKDRQTETTLPFRYPIILCAVLWIHCCLQWCTDNERPPDKSLRDKRPQKCHPGQKDTRTNGHRAVFFSLEIY